MKGNNFLKTYKALTNDKLEYCLGLALNSMVFLNNFSIKGNFSYTESKVNFSMMKSTYSINTLI